MQTLWRTTIFLAVIGCCSSVMAAAPGYKNLSIAVYFRYQETESTPSNMAEFAAQWANVESQVKIDKVYLETTRNGQLASEASVTTMKKFFEDRGIKVSAGMGLTVSEPNGYQSYCYTDPADRAKVKAMVEFTARHFDEIILDDFYFNNTKTDSDIAAKGDKTWSQFRTELMDEVSKNLIVDPAKAVNPKVHFIIKYPNWYESFQGLGYDLAVEPKIFDAIYTGTETRNANQGQRLQPYQSFLQTQYFNNIKPGGNQGGWIDGGQDADRYAEMFWDTFFAKVPEIMLFNSQQIMRQLGNHPAPTDPNATLAKLMDPVAQTDGTTVPAANVARIAGYSAELMDRFLGKLGKPIGVAAYKPCNSVGEEYLPNFLGMIGIPMDLVPEFPENASTIFLTRASAYDKDLVAKTKKYVQAGGRVIATTGLIEALGDKGFQDIIEIQVNNTRVLAKNFPTGGGRGERAEVPSTQPDLNILMPQIRHFENDTWPSIPFNTTASGYPMVVGTDRSTKYGKGKFYVIAIPDDFADLYRLPQSTLNQIRALLGADLFVTLDAPDHVSLFTYDNRTFIVQNFQSQPIASRVTVAQAAHLHDLLTDQTLEPSQGNGGGRPGRPAGTSFEVPVPAHSFRVFAVE